MKHKPTTWGEFKENIEVREGINDNTLLRYIDVDFPVWDDPDADDFVIIIRQGTDGIEISNN